ncbi:MAG: DUF814 domain-containing protein [Cyclobacteriaceae bacterium]|nr:DUF814 domain-containing protein [Cyclobacteriaceae bacterium HetDA_MAG_MS6]
MFHSYLFLRRLSAELNKTISGFRILECFSQNKDELILAIGTQHLDFLIKASLDPESCLLSFPSDFKRARKNSVDLFPTLIDKQIRSVDQVPYDRSFYLTLEKDYQLLFKMHGNRSNVVLCESGKSVELFKNNLSQDRSIQINQLEKALDISALSDDQVPILEMVVGKKAMQFLRTQEKYDNLDLSARKGKLTQLINKLEHSPICIEQGMKPDITMLVDGGHGECFDQPSKACNRIQQLFYTKYYLEKEKKNALARIDQQIKQSKNYLKKAQLKLRELESSRGYEEIANLIMANLHSISIGQAEAHLVDFYTDSPIVIKLKPKLSPQKNAELLYRKSKNQKIELDKLQENIKARSQLIESLDKQKEEIAAIDNLKVLKGFIKSAPKQTSASKTPLPYHSFEKDGYQILVGRNAKANDQLTLKVASKNDLWLHARDVAGSHVIIRTSSSEKVPNSVIEFAAGLAAANSKRKHDSLCPVIVTPRKYVRKAKGLLPGQMIVDREEVVMVEPTKV